MSVLFKLWRVSKQFSFEIWQMNLIWGNAKLANWRNTPALPVAKAKFSSVSTIGFSSESCQDGSLVATQVVVWHWDWSLIQGSTKCTLHLLTERCIALCVHLCVHVCCVMITCVGTRQRDHRFDARENSVLHVKKFIHLFRAKLIVGLPRNLTSFRIISSDGVCLNF